MGIKLAELLFIQLKTWITVWGNIICNIICFGSPALLVFLAGAKTFPIIFWPCASCLATLHRIRHSWRNRSAIRQSPFAVRGAKQIPYNYICAVQKYDIIQHFINPHKVAKCEKARKNKSPSSVAEWQSDGGGRQTASSAVRGHSRGICHGTVSFHFVSFFMWHTTVFLLTPLRHAPLLTLAIHNRAELLYFCTVSSRLPLAPLLRPCLRAHAIIHVRDVEN